MTIAHTNQSQFLEIKPIAVALMAASVLTACGGGGGNTAGTSANSATVGNAPSSSSDGTTSPASSNSLPSALPGTAAVTMSCPDGQTWQCSGGSILRTENGITLTSSGVQVYGKSTSDLAKPIVDTTSATGFAPASGGVAEFRINKGANGAISAVAVLLSNLGISWDGKAERPTIIETFSPTQGRVELTSSRALSFLPLPDSSNLAFYDYATKGAAATQANYANNRYFPRAGNPPRCPAATTNCRTTETDGITYQQGNWRAGGDTADTVTADRLHEDGDVHAGNGRPDANGNQTFLPEGNGMGVPFPGSKGYRSLSGWSFQYANLGAWSSQDTVEIGEWAGTSNEHNQNRRGIVAFGAVTDPAVVPTTGTASYRGTVQGWYSKNASTDPVFFQGIATVTVDFATRGVVVNINETVSQGNTVPASLKATLGMGAAGTNVANYLSGTADNGKLKGGIGGRYFGGVVSGGSGTGPAEIGGALSLSSSTTGETVIGGFIGRKQ